MDAMERYRQKYPWQTAEILGGVFPYRYCKTGGEEPAVVLLAGAIGLSDVFYRHFDLLARDFSVLTFDYPSDYPSNRALADAIAALLRSLGLKAYLVGQSLGGFIAQIVAQRHPDVVEGLVLSNTGTLSAGLGAEAERSLRALLRQARLARALIRLLPAGAVRRAARAGLAGGGARGRGKAEREAMHGFCGEVARGITKRHGLHMCGLLADLESHAGMEKADFEPFRGRVLLLLSDDDATFGPGVRRALIEIMPDPRMVTDIRGGHMAFLRQTGRYTRAVQAFIASNTTPFNGHFPAGGV